MKTGIVLALAVAAVEGQSVPYGVSAPYTFGPGMVNVGPYSGQPVTYGQLPGYTMPYTAASTSPYGVLGRRNYARSPYGIRQYAAPARVAAPVVVEPQEEVIERTARRKTDINNLILMGILSNPQPTVFGGNSQDYLMPMVMNQFADARGAGGATLSDFMLARVAIDPMRSQSVPIQDELLPFMLAQQGRNGGGMYSMPTSMLGFVPRMIPEDAPAEPKAYSLTSMSPWMVTNSLLN